MKEKVKPQFKAKIFIPPKETNHHFTPNQTLVPSGGWADEAGDRP